MAAAAASCSKSPPLPSRHSPQFTPIQEELEVDEYSEDRSRATPTPTATQRHHHPPTPIVNNKNNNTKHKKKRSESESSSLNAQEDGSVSCNKCRPHSRDKIFVLPILDHNSHNKHHSSLLSSPNGIFRSIVSKLTRKSPMSSASTDPLSASREDQWKLAVAELSHKLVQATRKRDEALLEASRLMKSMADLEKKLNKLEMYCHTLKSGLEDCNKVVVAQNPQQESVIQQFLVCVSEARSSVRVLSRSLTVQLRQMGGGGGGNKVYEKVSMLLQAYDIRMCMWKNPRSVAVYLEALLNRAFYEDFETVGFMKNACNSVLNPMERCSWKMECFKMVEGLTWEEVLSKGTRHFSSEFSRFCDRKMSEIVGMLGWNRAWPEALLQAFFAASKSVWMVHLLANSVHPTFSIFRVDKSAKFESLYMEDMASDKSHTLLPSLVRIMVAPGFYVYGSAVKCKVLCRYHSSSSTPAPPSP